MSFLSTLAIASTLLGAQMVKAEYRAFELRIFNQQGETERIVRSILDSIQYPEYYPLALGEQIEIIDSWLCKGNTSKFKPICPKPSEREDGAEENNLAQPENNSSQSFLFLNKYKPF